MADITVGSGQSSSATAGNAYSVENGGTLVVSSSGLSVVSATVSSGGLIELFKGGVSNTSISGGQLYVSGGNTVSGATVVTGGGSIEFATSGGVLSGSLIFGSGANALTLDKVLSQTGLNNVTLSGFGVGDVIEIAGGFVDESITYANNGSSVSFNEATGSQTFNFDASQQNNFALLTTAVSTTSLGITSGVELLYGQNVSVGAGATLSVFENVSALNTTITSGGALNLSGTQANTTVVGGGTIELLTSDATLVGTLKFSGGNNDLVVSALANSGAGDQAVISGFRAGDQIDIAAIDSAGASLSFATSGGNELVTVSNAANSETFVFSGTTAYTANTLVLSGDASGDADLMLAAGAVTFSVTTSTASGAYDVGSGNMLLVLSGGSVSAARIENGGFLTVSGGADAGALLSAGATETISTGVAADDQIAGSATVYGGAASGETILNGGSLVVSGGAVSLGTINSGASETVYAGGSATGDAISGTLTVSGGAISGETVYAGGSATLVSGAVDTGMTLLAGGTLTVNAATGSVSLSDDQIYGAVDTFSKHSATFTNETVHQGGVLNLANGNNATGARVLSGGELVLSGKETAADTTLVGGGELVLASPKATLAGSLTFSGGSNQLVLDSLSSDDAVGPLATVSGFSATDQIDITSTAASFAELSLSQTVSGADTVAEVLSGGTVVETFTFAESDLNGNLSLVSDNNGGSILEIAAAPTTINMSTSTASGAYTVTTGETLVVLSGGSVTAPTIESGGFLVVDGGLESGAIVQSGGLEIVSSGSASGDQIYGSAVVDGGAVSNEDVHSGGSLTLSAGAAHDTVLDGGATLDVVDEAAPLTGSLTFANGHNTLEIPVGATGDSAVISGYRGDDKIEIVGLSASGATLTFAAGPNGEQIATVANGGLSQSFTFADDAGAMSLAADGANVDLVLDTTPDIKFTTLDDMTTNQATYVVNGTVDIGTDPYAIGSTVSVYENGQIVGQGAVADDGYWHAGVALGDDAGANTLSATVTDAAGDVGATAVGQGLTITADTSAAAFVPGNLVISISGDGDGSGVYGDNQASPITLEQITTSGAIVSQLVLPQTSGAGANVISGEYGSSSEGTLELSVDGHSLTIAGYGVDDAIYNAGGAAVYGDDALAQTTSIPGGEYTAVARVIADINADGSVKDATALDDVYNTNNPRSVVTVDGSTFFISGQGDKNVTGPDQGVFTASDGSTTATALYTATDTRDVEIYDDEVYVSIDSKQEATPGIYDLGSVSSLESASGEVTPTILPGMAGSITLTAATANTVNQADIGQSVSLSPETFFFANADTLYVADGGAPKGGGLGDGGLQKWTLDDGHWQLDYTLSAGLNLVANTAGSASTGDTGLIGLTGEIVGNNVELFATTEPLNDLGSTAVVEITDQLGAAVAATDETFTTVLSASAGENIRGISFAPTAYTPTISGTLAGQAESYGAPISLFSSATIDDANANALDTLTIVESGVGGTLTGGPDLTYDGAGEYTLSAGAGAISGDLQAITFQSGGYGQTNFSLTDVSSASGTPAVDDATSVDYMPCFCSGARILTARGEVAVETLAVGDEVVTASGDLRPIIWIGHRRLDLRKRQNRSELWPVRICRDAFGANAPRRDLWLSPRHCIVSDGVLIPIAALINGHSIARHKVDATVYWHIELDAHDILYAEGLPTESYLDCGNRAAFENGAAFVEAHPDFAPKFWRETCLPMATEGAPVVAARRRLLEDLAAQGIEPGRDADPHLIVDDRRIEPIRLGERRYAFVAPEGGKTLLLGSNVFVPAETVADNFDIRQLGLCVASLQIDGEDLALDEIGPDALGWHEAEHDGDRVTHRWTMGLAALPAGARIIIVECAGDGLYWEAEAETAARRA